MRRESELRSRRFSARGLVITLGVLVFLFLVFGRGVAGFYVDALWHSSLGRSDVFWGQISAKVTLFVLFFAIFLVLSSLNLFIADRVAPTEFSANVHPFVERFHELFGQRLRLVRYGTAALLAFFLALPAASRWQDWLLFRNGGGFGVNDPQFNADVGFYVFDLPFISFAADWLFAALVVVILLTLVAHLLNGGVVFTSAVPAVRRATKSHLAVLLALLAVVKALDYWLTRYELTSSRRGFVDGATYTVVNAQLPALMLLILIALTTAVLFVATVRTDRWRLAVVASALWLVVSLIGGVAYPAVIESLVVRPNQEDREATYIARNVAATRQAYGLDDVVPTQVEFGSLQAGEVSSDLAPIENVRLLNPTELLDRFSIDRGEVAGLQIADLDVDRYEIDGVTEQVLIAARELDLAGIPNTSWQGEHLVSTRGCGVVLAPVGQVTTNGRPDYDLADLERPELYFSDRISGYAITGTDAVESRCGAVRPYAGSAGVEISGFMRRAAFALAFLDYNILGSGAINSDSQVLWVRSVRDRVTKLAPFLSFDTDPYPVIVDGGVSWVIDAFTTTSRYPYSQAIGDVQLSTSTGLSSSANYVRNSVKAVVDAYTGEVTFYVIDADDPIIEAWMSAFPDLFTPLADAPAELREHLRYPEDLFRVQTELYSKYQIAPEDFFQRNGAWSVAQAPPVDRQSTTRTTVPAPSTGAGAESTNAEAFASESNVERFIPYYTQFRNGITGEEEFVIFRPFVPFSTDDSRTELQAYMTASSDPANYGQLISYEVTNNPRIIGPLRVANQAESEPAISERLSLQANTESGTRVRFGDMQVIPVADGMIYLRPVYVISEVTEYRFIMASYADGSVMAATIDEALAQLFPGYDGRVGERVVESGEPIIDEATGETIVPDETVPTTVDEPPTTVGQIVDGDIEAILAQAAAAYDEAQVLLAEGDLGGYQAKMDEMGRLVLQAAEALDAD